MARKKTVDLAEAAAAFGMSPADLMRSRARGLEPGVLGSKVGGVLVWPVDALPADTTDPDPDPDDPDPE